MLPEDLVLAKEGDLQGLGAPLRDARLRGRRHVMRAPCATDIRPHIPKTGFEAGSLCLGRIARSNSMRVPGRRDYTGAAITFVWAAFRVVPCAKRGRSWLADSRPRRARAYRAARTLPS